MFLDFEALQMIQVTLDLLPKEKQLILGFVVGVRHTR
jgi:hypothetical protein